MDSSDRDGVLVHLSALVESLAPDDRHGRSADLRPALFVVSIEGFAELNAADPLEGEELMAEVLRRVDRLIRSADLLGVLQAGRLVLAVGLSPAMAGALLERLSGAVAMPIEVGGELVSLGAVIGVAFVGPDDLPWGEGSADALLARAEHDIELQRRRRSG